MFFSDDDRLAASARARLLATLRIQYPDALAPIGYRLLHPETGESYSGRSRHLVATARGVAVNALGVLVDGPSWCREAATHGLDCLREAHHDPANGGYALVIETGGADSKAESVRTIDPTRSAYAHAFVLLAFARATEAGIDGAAAGVQSAAQLLADRFTDPNGLLASDRTAEWEEIEPYRGQNANMHGCEGFLAAYRATGGRAYLDRASTIARELTVELAAETDGLIWEHYTTEWEADFGYNAGSPRHQFRPPGYQPGHHVEWAKLLALLDRYDDAATADWYERAVELFDTAIDLGWTDEGFVYTVDRDGDVMVADRYGWAGAEAVAAAAALVERAEARGESAAADRFREWHQRLVETLDAFRGPAGTFHEKRLVKPSGDTLVAPEPPGVEPDYHPAGAAFETWRSFR